MPATVAARSAAQGADGQLFGPDALSFGHRVCHRDQAWPWASGLFQLEPPVVGPADRHPESSRRLASSLALDGHRTNRLLSHAHGDLRSGAPPLACRRNHVAASVLRADLGSLATRSLERAGLGLALGQLCPPGGGAG